MLVVPSDSGGASVGVGAVGAMSVVGRDRRGGEVVIVLN